MYGTGFKYHTSLCARAHATCQDGRCHAPGRGPVRSASFGLLRESVRAEQCAYEALREAARGELGVAHAAHVDGLGGARLDAQHRGLQGRRGAVASAGCRGEGWRGSVRCAMWAWFEGSRDGLQPCASGLQPMHPGCSPTCPGSIPMCPGAACPRADLTAARVTAATLTTAILTMARHVLELLE